MTQDPIGITVMEAARILFVSRTSALKMHASGLLGDLPARGNRRMASVEAVRQLRQREEVDATAPAAFVVRIDAPSPAEGWRRWAGWHASWDWESRAAGVRGDWVIDPVAPLAAGVLVAVVGSFVAEAYAITGLDTQFLDETSGRRRSRFLVAPDEEVTAPFMRRRWTIGAGWTTAVVGGQS